MPMSGFDVPPAATHELNRILDLKTLRLTLFSNKIKYQMCEFKRLRVGLTDLFDGEMQLRNICVNFSQSSILPMLF